MKLLFVYIEKKRSLVIPLENHTKWRLDVAKDLSITIPQLPNPSLTNPLLNDAWKKNQKSESNVFKTLHLFEEKKITCSSGKSIALK
ncbi:hypothetical protein Hanom_Chr04g00372691 [Helianthus anomalus]